MSFVRTKEIPPGSGNFYLYRVRSERDGDTVKQVHEEYLGKSGGGGVRGGGAGLFKFLEEVRGKTPPPETKPKRGRAKKETEIIETSIAEAPKEEKPKKKRVVKPVAKPKFKPAVSEQEYVESRISAYKDVLTDTDRKKVEDRYTKEYQEKVANAELFTPARPPETPAKVTKPKPAKPVKEVKSTGVAEALDEIDRMVKQEEVKTEAPELVETLDKGRPRRVRQGEVVTYKIAPQPLVKPFEEKQETLTIKPEAKKPEPIAKKEQGYKLSPEMNKHIKSIKNTNEKEYAQKYAHFLTTGDKKDEPQRGNLTAEKAKALRADIYNIQNPEEKPEKPAAKKPETKVVHSEPIVTNAESVVVNAEPVVVNAEPIVVEVKPEKPAEVKPAPREAKQPEIVIGELKTAEQEPIAAIDMWYDRHTRSWVVQRKDKEGNQISDADYVYTKGEAQTIKEQYEKEIKKSEPAPKEVFKLDDTGTPHWNEKLRSGKGKVVYMTPDEYLSKSAEMQGTPVQQQIHMVEPELIDKYADLMGKGTKFDLPLIDYTEDSQEGRARALAAKKIGQEKIPVLLVEKPEPKSEPPEEKAERIAQEKADAESENIRSMFSDLIDEDKKSQSLKKIEKLMAGLDYDKYEGLEDVESAIEEYRSLERSGMTPEEYNDEKAGLFEEITSAIDSIEAVVEENDEEDEEPPPLGVKPPPAPPIVPSGVKPEAPKEEPKIETPEVSTPKVTPEVKEAKPSKEKTETFTPQFKGFDTYIIKKEPDLFKISGFKYSVYTEDDTPLEISGDSAREAEMNLRRQKKVRAVIVKD